MHSLNTWLKLWLECKRYKWLNCWRTCELTKLYISWLFFSCAGQRQRQRQSIFLGQFWACFKITFLPTVATLQCNHLTWPPRRDVMILLNKTSSNIKCDWLPRMGFFCLWELRTSCKDFFSEELIFLVRSSKYKQNPVKEFPWMKITSQKRALSSISCRQTKDFKRD